MQIFSSSNVIGGVQWREEPVRINSSVSTEGENMDVRSDPARQAGKGSSPSWRSHGVPSGNTDNRMIEKMGKGASTL